MAKRRRNSDFALVATAFIFFVTVVSIVGILACTGCPVR